MPKAGEDAANAGSRAGFTLLMGDGSGIREREGALRALQGRLEISAGIPFGTRLRELAHITRLGVVCCLRPPPVGFADSPR